MSHFEEAQQQESAHHLESTTSMKLALKNHFIGNILCAWGDRQSLRMRCLATSPNKPITSQRCRELCGVDCGPCVVSYFVFCLVGCHMTCYVGLDVTIQLR